MGLFRWRAPRSEAPPRSGRSESLEGGGEGRAIGRSRALAHALGVLVRRRERGEHPRVLLCGPPSGKTIETFTALGCRVTVEGVELPSVPIEQPDASFDLVLGFEHLDLADDELAPRLVGEWARVLAPGARLYLLTHAPHLGRGPSAVHRFEVGPGGEIGVVATARRVMTRPPRQNRELDALFKRLEIDEIVLRRDGLREVVALAPAES